jgi:hypothetical protein
MAYHAFMTELNLYGFVKGISETERGAEIVCDLHLAQYEYATNGTAPDFSKYGDKLGLIMGVWNGCKTGIDNSKKEYESRAAGAKRTNEKRKSSATVTLA